MAVIRITEDVKEQLQRHELNAGGYWKAGNTPNCVIERLLQFYQDKKLHSGDPQNVTNEDPQK